MSKRRKPPRQKIRRAVGPVELPKSDADFLADAMRAAVRAGVVGAQGPFLAQRGRSGAHVVVWECTDPDCPDGH